MSKKTKKPEKPVTLKNYTYEAEFAHGSATGEVQATSDQDAKDRVKAMYHDNPYDTEDAKGKPVVKKVVVTNVTVTLVKE
jgi:hypothetical protein